MNTTRLVSAATAAFGLATGWSTAASAAPPAGLPLPVRAAAALKTGALHEIYGTIRTMTGSQLGLQTRTGLVRVDAADALRTYQSAVLFVGRSVMVRGAFDAAGVLHAQTILRAKDSPEFWSPDR